jgi:preprotein translocase subunit YajC
MNPFISDAMAQGAPGAAPGGSPFSMLIFFGLFFVIMYFFMIRPQQKKAKEHQAMLSKLAEGDEVVTAGGILGRIKQAGEQFITIEISEGVHIKVQRGHVQTLVPKGTYKAA